MSSSLRIPTRPLFQRSLENARVTVMGLGNFGGGAGVTRWLCEQGATVLLTDLSKPDTLTESLAPIQDLISRDQVALRLGEHNIADFTTCDLLVVNPAVPKPWDNRFLRAAAAANISITTEIRLLIEQLPAFTIGITGSAGKSTTSAMIAHALSHIVGPSKVHFGGNIGGSLLPSLKHMDASSVVVLELSSAMLYWLGHGIGSPQAHGWSPTLGLLTNLKDNHADWHGSFDHYAASKLNLFKYQVSGDQGFVAQPNEDIVSRLRELSSSSSATFPQPSSLELETPPSEHEAAILQRLRIPGKHNILNARAAAHIVRNSLAHPANPHRRTISLCDALEKIVTFPGLPHRLEFVGEHAGVRYFNDSKSTTPESCLLALSAFDESPGRSRLHLIAGGYDKGSDLSPIGHLASTLAGLYTIGQTGPQIAIASEGQAIQCGDLTNAMNQIRACAKPGDVVLLSPACASWGQFKNYEERGTLFRSLIPAT